ncbi:MAG: lipoprotein-releasing system transmembrane subunit LolC [Candidatus Omnitrophota bacterium]|nr:MAG: lipoprotein-releasing system transmembrane subunit LolC [Candidatus Omnitrophota bacterium]
MRAELFISWRYLATKRKEKFISLISIISVLGIAIGVMALIVVIAVMTGFDKDLRDKIVGNYSHITVSSLQGIEKQEYLDLSAKIKAVGAVKNFAPYVQGQVLIKHQDKPFAINLKGIDPEKEARVTKLENYLLEGNISDLGGDQVIIGKELALYFGLMPGSKFSVYSAKAKEFKLEVAGIFSSGMYDYDLNLMFTDLDTAQKILSLGSRISAIAVKLDNLYLADKIKEKLDIALGPRYTLKTWMEANQNFFAALQLEKLTMFIILTLVILVASFNIISTLIVMAVTKTKDIGILKAVGMNSKQIRNIFTYEGLILGFLGTFFGTAGGILLCILLKKYQFIKLPQDIYYIDRLPVAIALWPDITLIILAAMVITLVSTVYPARRAARFAPVEALRYE